MDDRGPFDKEFQTPAGRLITRRTRDKDIIEAVEGVCQEMETQAKARGGDSNLEAQAKYQRLMAPITQQMMNDFMSAVEKEDEDAVQDTMRAFAMGVCAALCTSCMNFSDIKDCEANIAFFCDRLRQQATSYVREAMKHPEMFDEEIMKRNMN